MKRRPSLPARRRGHVLPSLPLGLTAALVALPLAAAAASSSDASVHRVGAALARGADHARRSVAEALHTLSNPQRFRRMLAGSGSVDASTLR